MTINEMRDIAFANSTEKGFHDEPMNIGEKLMLVVSEVSEALEADRRERYADISNFNGLFTKNVHGENKLFEVAIKDTFEDELADAMIRIGDICGALNIDIEEHVKRKMIYNSNRPHKHGKKY
jgi:NTP pyrophosphatase (non-canonical NTP hydrolase)